MEKNVTSINAICSVFGTGQKLSAVSVDYDKQIDSSSISIDSFEVEGRSICEIELCERSNCRILLKLDNSGETGDIWGFDKPGPDGKWFRSNPQVMVRQKLDIKAADGSAIPAWNDFCENNSASEPLVELFSQEIYKSERTGMSFGYNLFLPEGYNDSVKYPLVMFIHDRGPLSDDTKTALRQGRGALTWVEEDFQKKHPCIVVAPQFDQVPANNIGPNGLDMVETIIDFYEDLKTRYSVDTTRCYSTGQSMGCMTTIAASIRKPDLFSACYLVAGQWDPEAMSVLADSNLLVVVSRGDPRAFVGMNESIILLDDKGAEVAFSSIRQDESKEVVNEEDMQKLLSQPGNIHYGVLRTKERGFQCHMGTWKVAYDIAATKEWLFSQSSDGK